MNKIPSYTIQEISQWSEKKTVSLPTVQRGFVWKPYQIENFWDSLLRGYPIGAFVLSPRQSTKGESEYEMLDGQQRATAICLGFRKETFRDLQDNFRIFIDLGKLKNEDNRKYIFRIITRSQPWGYQRIDNTKPLDSDKRRKAMNLFNVENYLQEDLDKFFPYDAIFPIPFHYFIDSAINGDNEQNLLDNIIKWPHYNKILKINTAKIDINNKDSKKVPLECISENNTKQHIQNIFNSVKEMLHNKCGQRVPILYLDFEKFKKAIDYSIPDKSDHNDEENDESIYNSDEHIDQDISDEIETLFIRLNAGGTPLRGEELNYSVLKANITQELQNKIEHCCEGIFKPSRFITIAYRLFQNMQKEESRDAITMRIKPKQFQKTMSLHSEHFKKFMEFLKEVMDTRLYNNKKLTLIEYVKYLLEYNEQKNSYGLPYLITCKLADNAPEVMFMVLYRLLIKKDIFDFGTDDLHRKMLGMITIFYWLGKGEKQRDYAKLLSNIWPCVKTLKTELFWSSSTVQRALLNDILIPFPSYNRDREKKTNNLVYINTYDPRRDTKIKQKYNNETTFGRFIDKIFFNVDLILYAQRRFLATHFNEEYYSLDDTNIPFDLDHISPQKYVHRISRLPIPLKDWYNSNGNLRAWPYSLNRIDQDKAPAIKLNPLNRENYPKEDNETYIEICNKWKEHLDRPNLTGDELKELLKDWSFCDDEWITCNITDMKKEFKQVYKLIMNRNLSICQEWYEQLKIDKLIPQSIKAQLYSVIDNRSWQQNPNDAQMRKTFDFSENVYWISRCFRINKHSIYFYFGYQEETVLEEDKIEFGIFEKETNGNGFISTFQISEELKRIYDTDGQTYVQGIFTLLSFDEDSYVELFTNFLQWLKKFPKQEVQDLANTFVSTLVKSYQKRIIDGKVGAM